MDRLQYPERPGSVQDIADEFLATSEPARITARIRRRQNIADLRLSSRRTQGKVRLADAFAKLSGGSLLTATVLLIVNGQVSWPIISTALVTLLVFLASTMFLIRLDRAMADFDHAIDVIEAALKETER